MGAQVLLRSAPCNLLMPRIADAIVVSCPQSNSESLPSSAASSVVSRTVSSSGDGWGSPSNDFLSNGAGACDPFDGVFSACLSNVVVCDEPFNGVPSLGEGAANDGADARLGLKSRGRHCNGSCPFACLYAFNASKDTLSLSALF
jgi:hypothetical protein